MRTSRASWARQTPTGRGGPRGRRGRRRPAPPAVPATEGRQPPGQRCPPSRARRTGSAPVGGRAVGHEAPETAARSAGLGTPAAPTRRAAPAASAVASPASTPGPTPRGCGGIMGQHDQAPGAVRRSDGGTGGDQRRVDEDRGDGYAQRHRQVDGHGRAARTAVPTADGQHEPLGRPPRALGAAGPVDAGGGRPPSAVRRQVRGRSVSVPAAAPPAPRCTPEAARGSVVCGCRRRACSSRLGGTPVGAPPRRSFRRTP